MVYSGYLPPAELVPLPLQPGNVFDLADPKAHYWIQHGVVFFGEHPVEGADATTFRCYLSDYAVDARNVYKAGHRDRTLSAASFRCYSLAYHGDDKSVRTRFAGQIPDADVETFRALDRGYEPIHGGEVTFILQPTGYAMDRARVYWCENGAKGIHVTKADPSSFEAVSGLLGKDDRNVFAGRSALPKVHVRTWRRIAGSYSTDEQRVYYFNRIVPGADPGSFSVHSTNTDLLIHARDSRHFYCGDSVISQAEFERYVR